MLNRTDWMQWKTVFGHLALILCLAISQPLLAQDDTGNAEEDTADLGKLRVTGSRIQRLDVEGPSPVTIITREEIEKRGFATVYEALENLTQNTGTLQGEQYANSFTPNAQSLSLRSFGGGATLVLLNGKRAADYPQPYNSQSNFFNFAQIPAAAIDRVEILASGASAVYGSDAVAGVINIILRDDVSAPTLTARVGRTLEGGGDSRLLSLVWG
jgi:outer membrane receptor for ferrienterochelin and colicin